MKRYLLLLLASSMMCFVTLNCAERLPLKLAIDIVRKAYNYNLRQKAIADIRVYAAERNDTAMFAMGMVYAQGLGINKDLVESKRWYEKASEAGYMKADYNLAMMYRRGIGVEQNFEKAYEYLLRASQSNYPQTLYAVGYFLYKGFGCSQNYIKAAEYFQQAAEKNHGYAMYMLGMCYRNGYGVDRDLSKAEFWLKKAAEKNVLPSQEELQADEPENPIQPLYLKPLHVKGNGVNTITYHSVKHDVSSLKNIHGTYSGMLISYDWSGQHVVKESKLDVIIQQYGNEIRALWKEEGAAEVDVQGLLTDTALVFKNATYYKPSHPNRNNAIAWNFVK